jgi:hypothetical protein
MITPGPAETLQSLTPGQSRQKPFTFLYNPECPIYEPLARENANPSKNRAIESILSETSTKYETGH